MNPPLWARVLVGWLALDAAFVLGCWWAGRKVDRLQEVIEGLQATQDHRNCQVVVARLSSYIRWQEERLDAVENGPDAVITEAEQFLREAGA